MYDILSDLTSWLNYKLCFSDGIAIAQKSQHTLLWDISLISVLKELGQFK